MQLLHRYMDVIYQGNAGAIAEKQISAIHGGSTPASMRVLVVDRCHQFMPLTVNGTAELI